MKWLFVVGAGLSVSVAAVAGWGQPMAPPGTPALHRSACELGQSMAGKLAGKPMTVERSRQTCEQLTPTMREADAAEFKRCCAARLQAGGGPATR